jgi:hypothetical protein
MAGPAVRHSLIERYSGRQNLVLIALALVAVIIRIAPGLRFPTSALMFIGDSGEYLALADGLRHGCGFARLDHGACLPKELFRTPGYPLLLATFGGIRSTLIAQAVMGGIICLLVANVVGHSGNFAAALMAEALVAFDVPSIVMSNFVMSESLFQFMLFLAIVPPLLITSNAVKRSTWWIVTALSAAAGGYAILTRPVAILLPFVMPIPFLFMPRLERRRRFALAAIAFVIPALTMGGWIARNFYGAGYPGLSIVSTINLYYYTAANVEARRTGADFLQTQEMMGSRLGVSLWDAETSPVQSPESLRQMQAVGESILLADPWEAALMSVQGSIYNAIVPERTMLARLLGVAGDYGKLKGRFYGALTMNRFMTEVRSTLQSPLLTGLLLFELVMVILMWAGVGRALFLCLHASAEYRVWILYLTLVSLFFLVTSALGSGGAVRFRVPVVPLLAIVASLGYFPVVEKAKTSTSD